MHLNMKPSALQGNSLHLSIGEEYEFETLCQKLTSMGYEHYQVLTNKIYKPVSLNREENYFEFGLLTVNHPYNFIFSIQNWSLSRF